MSWDTVFIDFEKSAAALELAPVPAPEALDPTAGAVDTGTVGALEATGSPAVVPVLEAVTGMDVEADADTDTDPEDEAEAPATLIAAVADVEAGADAGTGIGGIGCAKEVEDWDEGEDEL